MNKITTYKGKINRYNFIFFFLSFFLIQTLGFSQNGKEIFTANCTACHMATADRLVGPGLAGVNDRHSREWLVKWVANSTAMVEAGDAEAKAIFDEYQVPMTAFDGVLSTEEVNAIFDYLVDPEAADAAAEVGSEESSTGDAGLAEQGQKIFKANCAACHSIGVNKVVGPGLKGIEDRRELDWILKWVKNSGELIASGDADANAIFEEFNKMPMPPQSVSEDEIKAILAYIKNPPGKKEEVIEEEAGATPEKDSTTMMYVLIGLIVISLILLFVLNKSRVAIAKKIANDNGEAFNGPVSLLDALKFTISKNKGLVVVLIIVLFFGGLVDLMDGAFQIGVHEGYKPEQPIRFSHKVHAGDDKIDCNYCHSSARHSKTSGIPSLNVCMNCHKYIKGGEDTVSYYGEKYAMKDEIQKIYDYLDYDPKTQEYGDNPTPVKWIKVHNLPDHVFYSHQQHVVAGKQKCQTCHGPVEEMDVVEQYSPLTMKWCIECHKATSVATEGNGYYEDMHDRMTPEYKEKVLGDGKLTVDEIGGWECAKCHY